VLNRSQTLGAQAVSELTGLVGEANSLLATSTQLEAKYLALPSYAERRNSMQLLEDAHVRFWKLLSKQLEAALSWFPEQAHRCLCTWVASYAVRPPCQLQWLRTCT